MTSQNLPSGRRVAVPLLFEVGHAPGHPVVYLGEGQPPIRGTFYRLGDQLGVAQVAPRVFPENKTGLTFTSHYANGRTSFTKF